MTNKENPILMFGLICHCVANTMDEEGLCTEDALKAVRRMLTPVTHSKEVLAAISRLEASKTEADLWLTLHQEALRAKRLNAKPLPTSLFE
jgi:hypothetical protein